MTTLDILKILGIVLAVLATVFVYFLKYPWRTSNPLTKFVAVVVVLAALYSGADQLLKINKEANKDATLKEILNQNNGGGYNPELIPKGWKNGSDTSFIIILMVRNNGPYLVENCKLEVRESCQLKDYTTTNEVVKVSNLETIQGCDSLVLYETYQLPLDNCNYANYKVSVSWKRGFYHAEYNIYPPKSGGQICKVDTLFHVLKDLRPMPNDFFKKGVCK